jgi:hypothetical protein
MKILVLFISYGAAHLFDAALRAMLDLPSRRIHLPPRTKEELIIETSLPSLHIVDNEILCRVNGERADVEDPLSFIEEHKIVYSFLLDSLDRGKGVVHPDVFNLFDKVYCFIRSPWDSYDHRLWLNYDDRYFQLSGKRPPFPKPELHIENMGEASVDQWRHAAVLARLLEKVSISQTFLHEWLFDDSRLESLASELGVPGARVEEASRGVAYAESCMPEAGMAYWRREGRRFPQRLHDLLQNVSPLYPAAYLEENGDRSAFDLAPVEPDALFASVDVARTPAIAERLWQKAMDFLLAETKGKTIVQVPARRGSSRLPNKNAMDVGGNSLLGLTISQALEFEEVDEVFINTDSEDYAEEARRYGARVPFLRNSALATAEAPLGSVTTYFLWWLACNGCPVESLITMYPTSPGRSRQKIKEMIQVLQTVPEVRSGYRIQSAFYMKDGSRPAASPDAIDVAEARIKFSGHFIGLNVRLFQQGGPVEVFFHDSLEERIDIDMESDMDMLKLFLTNRGGLFIEDWSG